jgi:ABC-type bacteriocin/lantibiotic exporter with double-glycine peptidase domain
VLHYIIVICFYVSNGFLIIYIIICLIMCLIICLLMIMYSLTLLYDLCTCISVPAGKLQIICGNSAKRLMQLAQEWEGHRRPLVEKLREAKNAKTRVR